MATRNSRGGAGLRAAAGPGETEAPSSHHVPMEGGVGVRKGEQHVLGLRGVG